MKVMMWTLVLNVIVGIGTGLSVQPIQHWWEKRAISSQSKRLKRIEAEYASATYYALHPEFLICRLVLTCLAVCAYAVYLLFLIKLDVTPIHPGLWFAKATFTIPNYVLMALDVGNILLITVFTTFVGRVALNAYSLFERVRYFKTYVKNVPMEIRDVDMEKLVIAIARERPISPLSPEGLEDLAKSIRKGKQTTDAAEDEIS